MKGVDFKIKNIIYSKSGAELKPSSPFSGNEAFIVHGNIIKVPESITEYRGLIGDNIPDSVKPSVGHTAMTIADLIEELNVPIDTIVNILCHRMNFVDEVKQTEIADKILDAVGDGACGMDKHESPYKWESIKEEVINKFVQPFKLEQPFTLEHRLDHNGYPYQNTVPNYNPQIIGGYGTTGFDTTVPFRPNENLAYLNNITSSADEIVKVGNVGMYGVRQFSEGEVSDLWIKSEKQQEEKTKGSSFGIVVVPLENSEEFIRLRTRNTLKYGVRRPEKVSQNGSNPSTTILFLALDIDNAQACDMFKFDAVYTGTKEELLVMIDGIIQAHKNLIDTQAVRDGMLNQLIYEIEQKSN